MQDRKNGYESIWAPAVRLRKACSNAGSWLPDVVAEDFSEKAKLCEVLQAVKPLFLPTDMVCIDGPDSPAI